MQTSRGAYSLRKWVFCHGFGECLEGKNMYMWLEATTPHDFSGEFLGKSCHILFGALKYGVATLNICPDLPGTNFFQGGDKLLHRQRAIATNVDATKKGNVPIHSVTL